MLHHLSHAFQGDEHTAFMWPGGPKAALLIHGFPGTPAEMHPLAMLLHEAGWSVDGPLLPGFGADIATLPDHHHADWVGAIDAEVRLLKQKHQKVILIGHSMGGALSLHAATHLQPDALILFAPFWKIDHMLWSLLPFLKHLFRNVKLFHLAPLDFNDAETRRGIHQFMPGLDLDDRLVQENIRNFSIPVGMIDEIRLSGEYGYKSCPQIRIPTLVIQGTEDDLVRPELTRQLVARLAGPVHYKEVHGGHNLITGETESWKHVERAIFDFLDTFNLGKK